MLDAINSALNFVRTKTNVQPRAGVVLGSGLDDAFMKRIKTLGLKIIREDELPRFFGEEGNAIDFSRPSKPPGEKANGAKKK